jgi:hypothetical protein
MLGAVCTLVISGLTVYLCLISAAVGLSFLQFTNMNSMRNLFIVGVSIFLGLSVPEYFFRYTMAAGRGPSHTKAGWVRLSLPFAYGSSFQYGLSFRRLLWFNFLNGRGIAVQRLHQHHLLVATDSGADGGRVPGQYAGDEERGQGPGHAVVGAVPVVQGGQPERGVLQPALQPQPLLPSVIKPYVLLLLQNL